jgi:hypothetical protein
MRVRVSEDGMIDLTNAPDVCLDEAVEDVADAARKLARGGRAGQSRRSTCKPP